MARAVYDFAAARRALHGNLRDFLQGNGVQFSKDDKNKIFCLWHADKNKANCQIYDYGKNADNCHLYCFSCHIYADIFAAAKAIWHCDFMQAFTGLCEYYAFDKNDFLAVGAGGNAAQFHGGRNSNKELNNAWKYAALDGATRRALIEKEKARVEKEIAESIERREKSIERRIADIQKEREEWDSMAAHIHKSNDIWGEIYERAAAADNLKGFFEFLARVNEVSAAAMRENKKIITDLKGQK